MADQVDRDPETKSMNSNGDMPPLGQAGRSSISPRMTYMLIGGAALGLIVLMCMVVALIAALQGS